MRTSHQIQNPIVTQIGFFKKNITFYRLYIILANAFPDQQAEEKWRLRYGSLGRGAMKWPGLFLRTVYIYLAPEVVIPLRLGGRAVFFHSTRFRYPIMSLSLCVLRADSIGVFSAMEVSSHHQQRRS